jgi:hypothetical protein
LAKAIVDLRKKLQLDTSLLWLTYRAPSQDPDKKLDLVQLPKYSKYKFNGPNTIQPNGPNDEELIMDMRTYTNAASILVLKDFLKTNLRPAIFTLNKAGSLARYGKFS